MEDPAFPDGGGLWLDICYFLIQYADRSKQNVLFGGLPIFRLCDLSLLQIKKGFADWPAFDLFIHVAAVSVRRLYQPEQTGQQRCNVHRFSAGDAHVHDRQTVFHDH